MIAVRTNSSIINTYSLMCAMIHVHSTFTVAVLCKLLHNLYGHSNLGLTNKGREIFHHHILPLFSQSKA